MKRVIAITALVVLGVATLASAQTAGATGTRPLADVAKDEEARRKTVRTPAKVYTNTDLRSDYVRGVAPPPSAPPSAGANATPSNATPPAPGSADKPAAAQDQAYWSARMRDARVALDRSNIFADSLQSRINALRTEYVNRDDPAQRSKIDADRNSAIAELERVKKDIETQTKAIKAVEDEARRAGIPAGWLRQ